MDTLRGAHPESENVKRCQKLKNGLLGVGLRTDEVAAAAAEARKNLEGSGTYNSETGEVKIFSKDDLAKMSDRAVLMEQDELNAIANRGTTQEQRDAINAIIMTPWGWSGSPSYNQAKNQLKQAGTHEEVNGKIPTREEAKRLIEEGGGKVIRSEGAHGPDSVSEHKYPHINYETASGLKATVRVKE